MLDAIATPFGWLMMRLYELTNNFGWAIILFAIVVALVLLPFMAKSKKSMMRMSRLQPRMMELQKKHEGNPQKLNEEMARLYRENHVSPLGGCLWSLLPFPILLALYRAVVKPITIMMGVADELLAPGGAIYEQLQALGYSMSNYTTSTNTFYEQIYQSKFISEHFDQFSGLSDKLVQMDYSFLGLDLSQTPDWHFWSFDFSNGTWVVPAPAYIHGPELPLHVRQPQDKPAGRHQPAAAGQCLQHEDHDDNHASHEPLDRLHHACRPVRVLDHEQPYRHPA